MMFSHEALNIARKRFLHKEFWIPDFQAIPEHARKFHVG
jgi:hypothetical protein